jgi:hypothetical protein
MPPARGAPRAASDEIRSGATCSLVRALASRLETASDCATCRECRPEELSETVTRRRFSVRRGRTGESRTGPAVCPCVRYQISGTAQDTGNERGYRPSRSSFYAAVSKDRDHDPVATAPAWAPPARRTTAHPARGGSARRSEPCCQRSRRPRSRTAQVHACPPSRHRTG